MTAPVRFTQAEVTRAIKAVRAGWVSHYSTISMDQDR